MAQITRGVVNVTNGSAVVTGDAAALFSTGSPAVAVSDLFKVNGETTYYSVLSVDSDTQITLTSNYGGSTNTGLNYTITQDFYVNLNMIRVNAGDAELAEILDRNFQLIDTIFGTIVVSSGNVGIGTSTPAQKLDIVGDINLENTTSADTGIIYKNGRRFIHNFRHPTGDTAVPEGFNIFIGEEVGNLTMGSTATSTSHGSHNIGIGYRSLYNNTTGSESVAIGHKALYSNDLGYYNLALGSNALTSNTEGYRNIAIGLNCLLTNLNGYDNVGIGIYALNDNTTGKYNTVIGNRGIADNTTGSYNVALGYEAGRFITGGSTPNETSSNSVYLGRSTRAKASGDTNEIVIGDTATGIGSNTVTLGNDSIVTTALKGKVGIGTTSPTELLDVNSDGIRIRTAQTPATASSTGKQGEIAWDTSYIYVCTATNTWKRTALSTW